MEAVVLFGVAITFVGALSIVLGVDVVDVNGDIDGVVTRDIDGVVVVDVTRDIDGDVDCDIASVLSLS